MKKSILLTFGLLLVGMGIASAQKFGYTNSVALLAQLPEVQAADANVKALQTQLTKKGEQMVTELQTKAMELEKKKEAGIISPKDYETEMVKLQEEEKVIQDFEQNVYNQLTEKREKEFKPILEKVNDAMKAVAKDKGLLMVFDTSTSVLLYADESLDVTKDVKAKLGITDDTDGQ